MTPDETSTVTMLRDTMAVETRGHHLRSSAVTAARAHVIADESHEAVAVTLERDARPRTARRVLAPWLAAAAIVAVATLITTVLVGGRTITTPSPRAARRRAPSHR